MCYILYRLYDMYVSFMIVSSFKKWLLGVWMDVSIIESVCGSSCVWMGEMGGQVSKIEELGELVLEWLGVVGELE